MNKDRSENAPVLSIITVNYNGLTDTIELIDSLVKHIASVNFEIIVVDNASRVDEAEVIREKYPDVITIRSDRNLGFSGGNNLGILKAKGTYIFLINNDTYVTSDGFRALIDRLESNSSIAAVSPKIIYTGQGNRIQFAGYEPLTKITLRNDIFGFGEPDDGRWNKPAPTPIMHGAAMMLKKSAIEQVGMMPEIYFLYYEELDWSASFLRAGYELWYDPSCVIYHKGAQSTGAESPLRIFYMTRNRLLYASRNLKPLEKSLSILYQILLANPKTVLLFFLKGKPSLSKACIRGVLAFFRL